MRVIITASGIQDYIFNITERKASARLRGRSARLGLVMDLCLFRLQEKFGNKIEVKRNAGSRLEVEIPNGEGAADFLEHLRQDLDEHSHGDLNGEVWFAVGHSTDRDEAYKDVDDRKFAIGKAILQRHGNWDPTRFVFDRWPSERALQNPDDADAITLPEAVLGRNLADMDNHVVTFNPVTTPSRDQLWMLGHAVKVKQGQADGGLSVAVLDTNGKTVQSSDKRMARYAPKGDDGQLLDLDEIAKQACGAKFLGVLKADLDGLGETFKGLNEKDAKELSDHLEALFTEELENLIRSNADYEYIYVVYSGGDDLFLLGPWDKLIRFVHDFHSHLAESFKPDYPRLTLSAGFKLAHPKSPVRFLATDVETSLEQAKGRGVKPTKLKAKNRIAVFERVIAWDELSDGLMWGDRFITGASEYNLSRGLLQRLQYYADQFDHFFSKGDMLGLRAVPLLQDDWRRNIARVKEPLKSDLIREVQPKLTQLGEQGERMWRVIELASRFAIYALR